MGTTSGETHSDSDQAARGKAKSNGKSQALEQSFEAALKAAASSPASQDAWEHLEELADTLQRPDEVAEAYRDTLESKLTAQLRDTISRRAVAFHEEWFGDVPEQMHALLSRVIARDPSAEWAFSRLTVVLTVAERWDDLLALYDRTLETTSDAERRRQLLDDAAHVAKDFADQPGRAVDYLHALLDIEPSNEKLAGVIERLLERQSRWEDLVDLWQARLPRMTLERSRDTRVRIAACFLDKLEAPGSALEELRALVDESPGHTAGCEQLERIVDTDAADEQTRLAALSVLRTNYDAVDRSSDFVAVMQRAIVFADPDARTALRREAAARLAILSRDDEAMAHYAALLADSPTDTDARKQLRQLARRSGLASTHADALHSAADAAEDDSQKIALLLEAADVAQEALEDRDRAIALYEAALALSDADASLALSAAHRLNELLSQTSDDGERRLAVLERLATLERAAAVRRAVFGEAATLAAELGDADRALANWSQRVATDSGDHEALDAIVAVLERAERWQELTEALGRRAEASLLPQQRRIDLIRIAKILEEHLDDRDGAVTAWLSLREEYGDEPETVAALDRLLTGLDRHEELAIILREAAGERRGQSAELLSRVGDVLRIELSRYDEAATSYAEALGVDPTDEKARLGLTALIEAPEVTEFAGRTLARAYESTEDWDGILDLVEPRVAAVAEPRDAVRILREAASLAQSKRADLGRAQIFVARGLVLDPADTGLEHELMRLAEGTGDWASAATTYRTAIAESGPSPARAAHLYRAEGQILEDRLDDAAGATRAYGAAAELEPESLETQRALIRVAARASEWAQAARGAVALSAVRATLDEASFEALAAAADASEQWPALSRATVEALAVTDLPRELSRALHFTSARWASEHAGDATSAEDQAVLAAELDPRHGETLRFVAELQRTRTAPELPQTLLRIDALTDDDLDAIWEAAEVLQGVDANADATRDALDALYRKAARLLSRGTNAAGTRTAADAVRWSLESLVTMSLAAEEKERAVALLLGAAQLSLPREEVRGLQIRAARLLVELGRRRRAIDLLTRVLEELPDELPLVTELATLCEEEDRLLELITLRRRELTLTADPERKLALRLELSRLGGVIEGRAGRVDALRANLDDAPGDPASIEALVSVLGERGRWATLADALSEQAHKLEALEHAPEAAGLWTRVATVVETELSDPDRAIGALGRVVELSPTHAAYDDLARLHLSREEPAEAATWLAKRLETTEDTQRVAVLLRLARAQIKADQQPAATASLSAAFAQAPRNGEVRKLLLGLYRKQQDWQPLADALGTAAEHVGDTATILAYAREAAEIYNERLDQPDRAVPVLERAHALAPEDRRLKSQLAEGLRVAGRLDEARALLTGLIADFGRRRSPERAGVHLQLARVAHAQGDNSDALDHLERASKMDSANPTIMRTLAELARETGQYDRAERAYRALLLQVRRHTDDTEVRDRIGASEVLIELSAIAAERGQTEQAEELVESALEALVNSDDAASRVQQLLYERGDYGLLKRVLQTRLTHAQGPRRRAALLGALADLWQRHLGDPERGLTHWLEAIEADAGIPDLHDKARAAALELGKLDAYVDVLETLLERARRNTDVHVRCELLLRMSEAMAERSDFTRALEMLNAAEETGVREVDVWRAQAKLAGAQGDTAGQMLLLEKLTELGEDHEQTRGDALYRIAEVQLASEESIADGIDSLRNAFTELPRPERAARILGRASESAPMNLELLELFDHVARRGEDTEVLLVAIERRATHPDTQPEYIREGVELALTAEQPERAESLMLRAVEVGANVLDGPTRISWALLGLARRRHEQLDLAGAVKWLREAAEAADSEQLFALGRQVASTATQEGGDPALAAKLYETLLERDPTAREAWEPLADLYRRLGDVERLHRLVDETLDGLGDSSERNALRLQLVESMLDAEQTDGALEILRGVLLEDPEHEVAQRIMAEHLQHSGRHEELDELLEQQLMAAQARGDVERVTQTALTLGQRLAERDQEKAIETLRVGLDAAPEDTALMNALLEHLQGEDRRADRAELLLRMAAKADAEDAERVYLELADLYDAMEEADAALSALTQGLRRAAHSTAIRDRLQAAYEAKGDYRGLAQMLTAAAEAETELATQVDLLRRAASIHRELLSDPATSASLLEDAHRRAPEDSGLAMELASGLASAGEPQRAADMVAELLGATEDDALRLQLHMMRGDLLSGSGDLDGAIADYEAAWALDRALAAMALGSALRSKRDGAAAVENTEAERAATLRLVEVLLASDGAEEARGMLEAWVERERKDTDALQLLRKLDEQEERWDAVVKTCGRLVAVESGDAQAEAAIALAEACEHLGKPQDARPGLEHARRKQPENRTIRQRLLRIYEQIGAEHELARLLVQEADEITDEAERLTLLRRIAGLHVNVGDMEGALPILQEVVQLAPDDLLASIALADAFTALGELDSAEQIIDQGLEQVGARRTPELAALSHRKARIAGARGEATTQLELLQKAFAADKSNGQIAAELADLAEAVEEYDLAVKVLRTITLLDDCAITRVEAFLRQAKIAYKRDDRQRAVLWARKARHEAPDSAEVAAFLEELGE